MSCIPRYSVGVSDRPDKNEIRDPVLLKSVRAGNRRSLRIQQPSKQIAHQIVVFLIVNTWFLSRIANALDQRCLSSVCPTDNKDPEVGIFRSKFRGISTTFEPVLDPGEHECRWVCRIKGIRTVQNGFLCHWSFLSLFLSVFLWGPLQYIDLCCYPGSDPQISQNSLLQNLCRYHLQGCQRVKFVYLFLHCKNTGAQQN